jgi:transposase-like protein
MPSPVNTERYKNYRFPGEVISHRVWFYSRFPLSDRDVQEDPARTRYRRHL